MTEKIFDGIDYEMSDEGSLKKRDPKSISKALAKSVEAKTYNSLDKVFKDLTSDLRKINERKLL